MKKFESCEYDPWGCIHNTSFSSELMNRLNKLVLYHNRLARLASDKHSSLLGLFVKLCRKLRVVNMTPGAVVITPQFLPNLQMLPLAYCHVTHQLIGPIPKLRRKWSVMNTAPALQHITSLYHSIWDQHKI